MNICSTGHEEIVYESNQCPLCEALEELDELKDYEIDLENENSKLSEAYDSLSLDYLNLKRQVQITNPELLI